LNSLGEPLVTDFTPISSTAGGMLIGLSAVVLMLALGRVAGISGIVSRLLPPANDGSWRLAFVVGLLLATPLFRLVAGSWPEQAVPDDAGLMAAAGLLVGFGSVVGNGCTSGHGVCGLARLSIRSVVATVTFLATAMITVLVVRHGMGG
jgi:uncharacterized membrane protein YedE/YeeE